MPRLSRTHSSIGYEFTASSGFDYNYDPVDGRTSSQSPSKSRPFDPYSDDYPASDDFVSNSQVTETHHNLYSNPPNTCPPTPPRPRSPTPTRTPQPTSPSPSYILESTKPSTPLANPSSSRKLLILDLNGTLVFRSPHRPRPARRPYRPNYQYHNGKSNPPPHDDPYATFDPTALRPFRTVHPRPYMSSFASYLFHPITRTWLDTMIWSSAQPHSVADMVSRCFSDRKNELVAVWARDTLGLEEKDYHRKTQTTKDLAKPWAALPLRPSGDASDSSTTTPTSTHPPLVPSPFVNEAQPQAQAHSAHTTLLLDDSPLKAYLQPWNHLCICEYDAKRRSADLALQEYERKLGKQWLHEESVISVGEADRTPLSSAEESLVFENEHPDGGDIGTGAKKRKRPKKEKSKPKKLQTEAEDAEDVPKVQTYDQSLLAVIGILDALKHESNVAGWIRSGQVLVPPPTLPVTPARPELENRDQAGKQSEKQDWATIRPVEVNGHEHGRHAKKRRVSDGGTSASADIADSDAILSSSLPPSTPLLSSSPLLPPSSLSTSVPGLGLIDANLVTPIPPVPADSQVLAQTPAPMQTPGQWYEDPKTVANWVKKGLNALDELGIEVIVGVGG